MTLRIGAALVVALLALSACEDDGASVRDLGGSASSGSGSGSGSATGVASGSGTTASGSATETAECETGDPADGALTVTLDEYQITPEDDEPSDVPAAIHAVNSGEKTHELYVVAARSVEALPLDRKGSVDMEALEEEGRVVAELEGIPAGESCDLEVDLEPDTYVLLCNIRERGEDGVVSHFLQGMRTRVKVQ